MSSRKVLPILRFTCNVVKRYYITCVFVFQYLMCPRFHTRNRNRFNSTNSTCTKQDFSSMRFRPTLASREQCSYNIPPYITLRSEYMTYGHHSLVFILFARHNGIIMQTLLTILTFKQIRLSKLAFSINCVNKKRVQMA